MKTNRPFEYTRYPEEREKVERARTKAGCLMVIVFLIMFWGAVAYLISVW